MMHYSNLDTQEKRHLVSLMVSCGETLDNLFNSTGIPRRVLLKWKKEYCSKAKGKLYVLIDERQKAFKIGITRRSVEERVKELHTSLCGDLEVYLVVDALDPEGYEGFIHKFLTSAGKHLKREWFNLDEQSRNYLQLLRKYKDNYLLHAFDCKIKHERLWEEARTESEGKCKHN